MKPRPDMHHASFTTQMWNRYRWWKHVVAPVLAVLAYILMSGEPAATFSWDLGIGVSLFLAVAYVGEEVFWIAGNRGRPCSYCGGFLRLKPFRLQYRCPHCGELL